MIKLFFKYIFDGIHRVNNAIFYSFDNKCDTGFDPRKLTSWTIVVMVVYSHIKYVDEKIVSEVLMIDYCFIALLLGIVTMEQLTKFKASKAEEEKPK